MNTSRVKQAVMEIERCEASLKWLQDHGALLDGRSRDAAGVSVHLNHASALPGAKEAQEMLSAMARFSLPVIVQSAIQNCRNTIDMEREVICREMTAVEPQAEATVMTTISENHQGGGK